MAKTGTRLKVNTLKQQREAAELESIIEQFGQAMRNADRKHIANHEPFSLTLRMAQALGAFYDFCKDHQ